MTSLNITCITYFIEKLKILWRNLRYEVNLHENKTSEEMRSLLSTLLEYITESMIVLYFVF
jgi:hypothetical protein